jgi:23S rRNA pseudouridine1911/1915/1917 synthase
MKAFPETNSNARQLKINGIKTRASLTNYEVLEYFNDSSLVAVQPVTGRTHQIRVHFSAIGHPLIGDTVYGVASKDIKRQALHAHSLSFAFGSTNYSFGKDVPDDFAKLLAQLRLAFLQKNS